MWSKHIQLGVLADVVDVGEGSAFGVVFVQQQPLPIIHSPEVLHGRHVFQCHEVKPAVGLFTEVCL